MALKQEIQTNLLTDNILCLQLILTNRKDFNIEDNKVEGHGENHGQHQPDVHPWRHDDQGLILG